MRKGRMVKVVIFIQICYLCVVGTNDAFVTIELGKEKFQTSVKEKTKDPEWCEQCEL